MPARAAEANPERNALRVAAGVGFLAGIGCAAIAGGLRVVAHADLAHGTFVLAARRLVPLSFSLAAYGAAFAILLALAHRAIRAPRPRVPARVLAAIAVVLWGVGVVALTVGPLRDLAVPAALAASRPKLCMAALLAMAGLWTSCWIVLWRRPGPWLRRAIEGSGAVGIAAAAVVVVAAATLPPVERSRARGRPSVIVVSLDTMRADALGALGGHDTPKLDRLAAEGTLFEQATAPAPWTLPSHASLFTSKLPFDHAARFSAHAVGDRHLTLAEVLRDAGYRTAGFTGDAYVDPSFGFAQGFDRYDSVHEDRDLARGPQPIADAALAWIRDARDRPFFAFIHTYEPHSPYSEGTFADPADRGRLPSVIDFSVVERIHRGELVLDAGERRYTRALYDGDVARTDRVIGGLLDTLRGEGVLDHAVVVVLSDHGEDFWDHDMRRSPGHGHALYQELLRVPLIVRAPGRTPSGTRLRTPVSLLDVAPTLLEMCGLPPRSEFHGRSLATPLADGREPDPVPVYSESVEYGPDRFAVREGRYKVVVVPYPDEVHGDYRPMVGRVEAFDLEADPTESADLVASAPAEVRRLAALAAERARKKLRSGSATTLRGEPAEELLKTLRSLGYVD